MMAGQEHAVAATKTFIASLTAIAAVIAAWSENKALADALETLPDKLERALVCDWQAGIDLLADSGLILVVGRGPGLSIANEAALKLKETCGLNAQAYSAAELLHGPIALTNEDTACLLFTGPDASRAGILNAASALQQRSGRLALVQPAIARAIAGIDTLPAESAHHPLLDPVAQITSFYQFIEKLASTLNRNPDAPAGLDKVTHTV